MIDQAFAMGNLGGGGSSPGGDISFFIMLGVLFAIFYFLIFRPQQKKQKEINDMLANLRHGDMVITSGGIHGKITALTDAIVTLEIAEKVRIKVSKSAITSVTQKAS